MSRRVSTRPDNLPTPREGPKPAMGSWAAKLVAPKPVSRPPQPSGPHPTASTYAPRPPQPSGPRPTASTYAPRPPQISKPSGPPHVFIPIPKPQVGHPKPIQKPVITPTPPPTPTASPVVCDLPWPETDDFNTPLLPAYQPPPPMTKEQIKITGDKVIAAILAEYKMVQEWNTTVLDHTPTHKTYLTFYPSLPHDYNLCAYVAQTAKNLYAIDIEWKYGQTSITIILDPVGAISPLPLSVLI